MSCLIAAFYIANLICRVIELLYHSPYPGTENRFVGTPAPIHQPVNPTRGPYAPRCAKASFDRFVGASIVALKKSRCIVGIMEKLFIVEYDEKKDGGVDEPAERESFVSLILVRYSDIYRVYL